MREITQKIIGFSVKTQQGDALAPETTPELSRPETGTGTGTGTGIEIEMTEMNEGISRPDILLGSTYKIAKSPASEHAMYVTINDIVLDQGTAFERRRPFEIFINSKNMDQFQWVVALTRILSAVFRKGGDVTFIVDEMKAVFDPHGGFFRKGVYVPSLIAEIGNIVEIHLKSLGILEAGQDPAMQAIIDEKRRKYEESQSQSQNQVSSASTDAENSSTGTGEVFPPNATMCPKCHAKATVIMDGCATCLSCGHSKCG